MAEAPVNEIQPLLARSRARELDRLTMLLGVGAHEATDGLRGARLAGPAGVGTSSLVELLVARRASDAPITCIDARRTPASSDALRDVLHSVPETSGRLLVVVDHAWEDDLLAAEVGALMDQLAPDADVSILLVESIGGGAAPSVWQLVLDELSDLLPLPVVELAAPAPDELLALLHVTHPHLPDTVRQQVLELAGGVPRVAMLLADAGGRAASTLAAWVDATLEHLDEHAREQLLLLACVEEGLHAPALGGAPGELPFTHHNDVGTWHVEPPAVRSAVKATASSAHIRTCITEAIERVERSDSSTDRIDRARLLTARGDRSSALELWRDLADEHEHAGRLAEAGVARRHAVALADDPADLLSTLHAAASTFREHGIQSAAEHALVHLHRVASRASNDELVAWSLRELAFTRGDVTLLDTAELRASDAGWAWEARAAAADNAADYEQVMHHGERALERALHAHDELLELRARDLLASASVELAPGHPARRDTAAVAAELTEIIDRAWAAGARNRALLAAHTEAYVTRLTARFDRSAEQLRHRIGQARTAGRPNHVVSLGVYIVEALVQQARIDEAEQVLAGLREVHDPRYSDRFDEAFLHIGELDVHVERRCDAALHSRLQELDATGLLDLHVTLRVAWLLARLRHALATDDRTAAQAACHELLELDTPTDDLAAAAADLARAAAVKDAGEQPAAWAQQLLARVPVDNDLPLVVLCRAEAVACLAADGAAMEVAAAGWRAHGCELRALRLDVCRVHVDAATRTPEQLRELKAALRSVGMRDAEDAINALLRASGHAARAPARPRGDAPLTEREEQVARLVVTGLTNREVADRLGVKPATIARILANVYERHSLPGRTSLVTFLAQLDASSDA